MSIRTKIVLLILLIIIAFLLISLNFLQPAIGPHDGLIKQAGNYNIEMKNNYPKFYAYLLDKKNIPVSNKGISCEVDFTFADQTTINIPLNPHGNDGFALESGIPEFYTCRIYFNVFGKYVSASFENANTIVQKK